MPVVLHIKPQPTAAMARKPEPPVGKGAPKGRCAGSSLRETRLSDGVPAADLGPFDNIVFARRLVRRGQCVFDAGDAFTCLYSIRSGFFKTSLVDRAGREQVTGFFMGGDLLGLDGLACGRCESYATALEDSEVCTMPYALLEGIARQAPSVQRRLHSLFANEILRGHASTLVLGSMCAEERLASFLLNLSGRHLNQQVNVAGRAVGAREQQVGVEKDPHKSGRTLAARLFAQRGSQYRIRLRRSKHAFDLGFVVHCVTHHLSGVQDQHTVACFGLQ